MADLEMLNRIHGTTISNGPRTKEIIESRAFLPKGLLSDEVIEAVYRECYPHPEQRSLSGRDEIAFVLRKAEPVILRILLRALATKLAHHDLNSELTEEVAERLLVALSRVALEYQVSLV